LISHKGEQKKESGRVHREKTMHPKEQLTPRIGKPNKKVRSNIPWKGRHTFKMNGQKDAVRNPAKGGESGDRREKKEVDEDSDYFSPGDKIEKTERGYVHT